MTRRADSTHSLLTSTSVTGKRRATLVPHVLLFVTLAEPTRSGSAGASRLCQGLLPPVPSTSPYARPVHTPSSETNTRGGPQTDARPTRQIRAVFDNETITVYQAYSPTIAGAAIASGTFVPPFKATRMTWIKPSFLWMMYRSAWATKPGQERILAIQISRSGFEEALASACLSHYEPGLYETHGEWQNRLRASPVRIQWDPERDVNLNPLPARALQVGLSGPAVARYVDDWIVNIKDITVESRRLQRAAPNDPSLLPKEEPYPLREDIAAAIGMEQS